VIRHKLADKQWNQIYEFLKVYPKLHTKNEEKCRKFVESVHWILRTGAPWRDIPAEFGNWNTVFKRFGRWADKGVWDKLHNQVIDTPDMEWLLLDSTVIRAHPCAAGAPKAQGGQEEQALGRSVGGFSTKIHVITDSLGNPLRLLLTGGQCGDAPQALPLMKGFDFESILADRGYDSDEILAFIGQQDAQAIIPSKKSRLIQRDTDWHLYKARHLVECFFNKIKQFRRIFSRFDKYASRYKAFLCFASALIWLR
jgi:transposase